MSVCVACVRARVCVRACVMTSQRKEHFIFGDE